MADVGAEERSDTLIAGCALAHFHQFKQIAEMQNSPLFCGLPPDLRAALLPHSKTGHSGDKARTASRIKRHTPHVKFITTTHQFIESSSLAYARFADEKYAAQIAPRQRIGNPRHCFICLKD